MTLGQRISQYRKSLGISQEALPDEAGEPVIRESPYDDLEYHDLDCGDITLTYGIHLSTGAQNLLAMQTSSRIYETPRGIGVGSTEDEVLTAYGDSLIYWRMIPSPQNVCMLTPRIPTCCFI